MLFIDIRTPRVGVLRYQKALFNVANMDSNGSIESVHINGVSVPLGGGYSLQWASWGRAARVSIISIFVLNRVSFLGQ